MKARVSGFAKSEAVNHQGCCGILRSVAFEDSLGGKQAGDGYSKLS